MNLPDLTAININKDKIINIIIIFASLLIVIGIFQSQMRNIGLLKEKKDGEVKKNEVLSNINQLEKILNSYRNIFSENKKDTSFTLNTISNIANESAVKIISIKPNKQENYPLFIKYSFDIAVGINNYHDIGQFISNLENYSDIYFIDKLSINSVEKYKEFGRVRKELDQTYSLIVDLTLSTMVLKD